MKISLAINIETNDQTCFHMKKYIFLLFLIMSFYSCKQSIVPSDVERISLAPVSIVSDSIESMMPGDIYLSDNYLLWADPFNSEKYIHVLDKKSGKELTLMIDRGEGPDEFVSPSICILPDDMIFIYDVYAGRTGVQSIEKAIQGENPIIYKESRELGDVTTMIFTENSEKIWFNPSKFQPFSIEKKGSVNIVSTFGKLPFEDEISNSVDHFQGHIAYNPYNQTLVYTTMMFPYYSIYQKSGNTFSLKKEVLNISDYDLRDGNFRYRGHVRGPQYLTLTSDYIVTVERDPKYDQTDGMMIGRDFTKLPQTIFLYNYELELKKIVDLKKPILWVTANPTNNTIYLIAADPDFVLLKYELE